MKNESISMDDIVLGCAGGEIVEDYPSAYPLPACLNLRQNPGWKTASRLPVQTTPRQSYHCLCAHSRQMGIGLENTKGDEIDEKHLCILRW